MSGLRCELVSHEGTKLTKKKFLLLSFVSFVASCENISVLFDGTNLANAAAHVLAPAWEPDPARFNKVGYSGKGFGFVAAATLDDLDEFTQVVGCPLSW
jgi:hypothetical protein